MITAGTLLARKITSKLVDPNKFQTKYVQELQGTRSRFQTNENDAIS
jgi:hypothetical protein